MRFTRNKSSAADASSSTQSDENSTAINVGPVRLKLPMKIRFGNDAAELERRRQANSNPLAKIRGSMAGVGRSIKGVGNLQQTLMTNMMVKVIAGVSGTLSGLLLAGLAYKVVGGYQDEIKEARREVQRQHQERKARLAQVRRLLSGPLRAAAKDLRNRLEFILKVPPRRSSGEPPKIRANYFAAHYPDNPNEAVNSTLFRLCRYLHWVEQFQRGVQLEGVSEQDTWQFALDQQLDRVAMELEVSDERYDATVPTERLTEVFALIHVREVEKEKRVEGDGADDGGDEGEKLASKRSIFRRIDSSLNEKTTAMEPLEAADSAPKRRVGLLSAEPQERLSRFPMRLFRDTQVALAEVFGKLHTLESGAGQPQHEGKVNPHMLYTEFVMKLEEAQMLYERTVEEQASEGLVDAATVLVAQQENLQADPWFRWMLPLQLQIRRLAMLQSQTSKLLTRKEARELLAARARLRGVLDGLNGLLDVLDRRLDDPLFNKPKHNLKQKHLATAKIATKKVKLEALKREKSLARWNKLKQAIPYVAKYRRLPPPPASKRYIRLVTGDELLAFVRRYKAKAVAGVVSAVSTAVVSTVISKVVKHQNKRPKAVEIVKTESESAESEGTTKEKKTNDEAIEGEFAAPTKTRPRLRNSVKVK